MRTAHAIISTVFVSLVIFLRILHSFNRVGI